MVVVVGTDVHKRSHTFVAVDEAGRQLGLLTVEAVSKGHDKAVAWAQGKFGTALVWGIEDCRHLSARLELDLLAAGQQVVRQRTAVVNRLRWHLHRIDPTVDPAPKSLNRKATRARLTEFLDGMPGIDARLARELLEDIATLTERANALAKEITALVRVQSPALLEIPGCGDLTAAKLYGETAGVARFAGEAKFAMHAGVAPIPVWSGSTRGRVRLNKAGNRQLNAALHRIAITQLQREGLGRAYYDKRLATGDSTTEALRCLKRRLARIVFNTLKNNPSTATATSYATAA